MTDASPLVDKFRTNILKSLKSPSPTLNRNRNKRSINESVHASYDSDISDIEPPHKKQRASNDPINNGYNMDDVEVFSENDIDREFDALFEIVEKEENTSDDVIGSEHELTSIKPRMFLSTNTNVPDTTHSNNTPRRRRYFDTNESSADETQPIDPKKRNITFKCYNCDEVGHIARNCTYDPIKICFKCGESGHLGYYCTNNICSFCLKAHRLHECNLFAPNKNALKFCIRCGSKQHYLNQCNVSLNRRLRQLQCFVCGKYGHLNCKADHSYNDKPKRVQLCSNCGDDGHTVYFCQHLKMNKAEIAIGLATNPNDPKICFNCHEANHCSRNCPLIIRKKQQRKKNLNNKFHYRSNASFSGKRKQTNKKHKGSQSAKKTIAAHQTWRKDTMNLIQEYNKPQ